MPFREEASLANTGETAEGAFLRNYYLLNIEDLNPETYLHDLEHSVQMVMATNSDIATIVAPNAHESNEDSAE